MQRHTTLWSSVAWQIKGLQEFTLIILIACQHLNTFRLELLCNLTWAYFGKYGQVSTSKLVIGFITGFPHCGSPSFTLSITYLETKRELTLVSRRSQSPLPKWFEPSFPRRKALWASKNSKWHHSWGKLFNSKNLFTFHLSRFKLSLMLLFVIFVVKWCYTQVELQRCQQLRQRR